MTSPLHEELGGEAAFAVCRLTSQSICAHTYCAAAELQSRISAHQAWCCSTPFPPTLCPQVCRKIWLGLFDARTSLIPDSRDPQKVKEFLQEKYEKKRW